jgi:hypothetical protein
MEGLGVESLSTYLRVLCLPRLAVGGYRFLGFSVLLTVNFFFFAQILVASSSLFRSPDPPIYGSPDSQFRQSAVI